ncbi:methylesterase 3-like [Chenopodium quinoa]|uniref:AB hydrolase-1 domain-containing protein n=1 Tax=Chenopodium quinoa TaxID=63459 RepID=A0A803LE12_CHEQI|nr:methylesterase 3-like [Chenopodium quinoa]
MEKTMRRAISFVLILFLFFAAASASTAKNSQLEKDFSKHIVLIHGSCFGAWSWYKIVPLLKSAGHMVTVIDLAASGINLLHATDVRSFSDYTHPFMDFMESIPPHKRVILVGHSSGGAVISQAMENFPEKVSVGVFLTAGMPGPSLNYSVIAKKAMSRVAHALDNKFTYDNGPNNPPTTFVFGPKFLSQVVLQYSPAEDAALATILVRPRPVVSIEGLIFTKEKYGSVSRVLIISEEDKIVTEDAVKLMIMKNPPNKIFTVKSSDHMVMLSQPTQLFAYLLSIAHEFS